MSNLKEDLLRKNSSLLEPYHETKKDNASDNFEENISYSSKNQDNLLIKFKNNENIVNSQNQDIQKKINALEKKFDYLLFKKLTKRKGMNIIKKEDWKNKSKAAKKLNLRKKKNNTKKIKDKNYQYNNYSDEDNDIEYCNDLKQNLDEENFKEKKVIKKVQIYNNKNEVIKLNQIFRINDFSKENSELDNFEFQTTIGFNNIGNTCYMNSFLQILFHIPKFLEELKKVKVSTNKSLITNLINLSKNPKNNDYLRNIKELMGQYEKSFSDYCQNDSQEFGIALLIEIIDSIKENQNFSDEEPIEYEINPEKQKDYIKKLYEKYKDKYFKDDIFLESMFQIHETFIKTELKNGIKIIRHIDFNSSFNIELSFPNYIENKDISLYALLSTKYLNPISKEAFKINNQNQLKNKNIKEINVNKNCKYYFKKILNILLRIFCLNESDDDKDESEDEDENEDEDKDKVKDEYEDKFEGKNNGEKKVEKEIITKKYEFEKRLSSLPKILIISINRAIFKKELLDNFLKYEDNLDVSNFLDKNICDTHFLEYKLYAVNECCGNSVNFGHYYSYVKIKGEWYKFNDSLVTKESPNYFSKNVVGLYYIKNEQ